MCLQKLVFSTQHKIIPLKTNFWTHTVTYLKFVPSNFLSKQKILQQKFCSSHYPFTFHNKNLAKKLSDFDEILTSKSTQMVFLVVKLLSKSDNFLAQCLLWNANFHHMIIYLNQNFCSKNFVRYTTPLSSTTKIWPKYCPILMKF